mmetsp:Transcript_38334/g.42772  ORF Transcript_38334/g.42772 Transcript_38334/m.42772 type:complete len:93 (-) Transcript_38334:11-289(-)
MPCVLYWPTTRYGTNYTEMESQCDIHGSKREAVAGSSSSYFSRGIHWEIPQNHQRNRLLSSFVGEIVTPSSSLQSVHGFQKRLTFSSIESCM